MPDIFDDSKSLARPAWTSNDLHAYRHKHVQEKRFGDDTRPHIIKNYYVKSLGRE